MLYLEFAQDIELFHKILLGLLDDSVYADQMKMLADFKTDVEKFCTDAKGKPRKGKPTKADLMKLVTTSFPFKCDSDIVALKGALDRDVPKKKGAVNWKGLFGMLLRMVPACTPSPDGARVVQKRIAMGTSWPL